MVDQITYRTTDPSRWGSGQGTDLSASQIDINFWVLYSLYQQLLSDVALTAGIDSFQITGNQLYVHLTDHTILGPYPLPVAAWNFRGAWQADTEYFPNDVITFGETIFLVLFHHTSSGSFDPFATDGHGHDFYQAMLMAPDNGLPNGGTPGQRLVVVDAGSPHGIPVAAWENDTRNLALFLQNVVSPSELVLQYVVPENMTLPLNLASPDSHAYSETAPTTSQVFELYKNNVLIGSITFAPSPSVTFTFDHAVSFVPGDVLTIIAPSHPDAHQTNISITLVATLP